MAYVSVHIDSMGRVSPTREFADTTVRVSFTPGEVRLNLTYYLHLALVEKDDGLDRYTLRPTSTGPFGLTLWNLSPQIPAEIIAREGDNDEFILYTKENERGWAWAVNPAGRASVTIVRRFEFEAGLHERGNEEYVAIVWIVPEVSMGQAVSNEFSIDLG